jgi:hypothetical protein
MPAQHGLPQASRRQAAGKPQASRRQAAGKPQASRRQRTRKRDTSLASSELSFLSVSPSFAIMAAWAAASGTLIAKSTSTDTARSLRNTRRRDVFSTTDLMYRLATGVSTEPATADKNLLWTPASNESLV